MSERRRRLWAALLESEPRSEAVEELLEVAPDPMLPARARSELSPSGKDWLDELAWIRQKTLAASALPWWWRDPQASADALKTSEPERFKGLGVTLKEAGSILIRAALLGEPGLAGELFKPYPTPQERGALISGPFGDGLSRLGEAMALAPVGVGARALRKLGAALGHQAMADFAFRPLAAGWAGAAAREARMGPGETEIERGLASLFEATARMDQEMARAEGREAGGEAFAPRLGSQLIRAFAPAFWDPMEEAPSAEELGAERVGRWAEWMATAARALGSAYWIRGAELGREMSSSPAGALALCKALGWEGARPGPWEAGGMFEDFAEWGPGQSAEPLLSAMAQEFGEPEGEGAIRTAARLFGVEQTALGARTMERSWPEGRAAARALLLASQSASREAGPPEEARGIITRWAEEAARAEGMDGELRKGLAGMAPAWRSIWEAAELSMSANPSWGFLRRPGL